MIERRSGPQPIGIIERVIALGPLCDSSSSDVSCITIRSPSTTSLAPPGITSKATDHFHFGSVQFPQYTALSPMAFN